MPEQEYKHKLIDLAAIRWFANAIENQAVQKYLFDPATYKKISRILGRTINDLHGIQIAKGAVCPYPVCPDGECKPDC